MKKAASACAFVVGETAVLIKSNARHPPFVFVRVARVVKKPLGYYVTVDHYGVAETFVVRGGDTASLTRESSGWRLHHHSLYRVTADGIVKRFVAR